MKLQIDEPWKKIFQNGFTIRENTIIIQICATGLPSFVWATFRHVRPQSELFYLNLFYLNPIFAQIKSTSNDLGECFVQHQGKSLEPTLVTLFYAIEACQHNTLGWRSWCTETLRKVVYLLNVKKVEEFRKLLEFLPLDGRLQVCSGWNMGRVGR